MKWVSAKIGIAGLAVFALGWLGSSLVKSTEERTLIELIEENKMLRQTLVELDQNRVTAETEAEISRQALEELRVKLVDWRDLSEQQKKELAFYRSLMDPTAVESILEIEEAHFELAEAGVLHFRVVVVQRGRNQQIFKGRLELRISALHDSGQMNATDGSQKPTVVDLDFQFFQRVVGQMEIPDSFKAGQVRISVFKQGISVPETEVDFSFGKEFSFQDQTEPEQNSVD